MFYSSGNPFFFNGREGSFRFLCRFSDAGRHIGKIYRHGQRRVYSYIRKTYWERSLCGAYGTGEGGGAGIY